MIQYIALAILGAFGLGWFSGCTHEAKEYNAYKASIEARDKANEEAEAAKEKARGQAAINRDNALLRQQQETADKFVALRKRNKDLDDRLAAVTLDAALADRLRDSVRTANEAFSGSAASPSERAAATPGTRVSGACTAAWTDKVGELYTDCRKQVRELVQLWNDQAAIK